MRRPPRAVCLVRAMASDGMISNEKTSLGIQSAREKMKDGKNSGKVRGSVCPFISQ